MTSHTQLEGGEGDPSTSDRQRARTANTPSDVDIEAMWITGRPVQTIGADVTTTLYSNDGEQARLAIDEGNRNSLDLRALVRDNVLVDPE